jgi:hypothetical protein
MSDVATSLAAMEYYSEDLVGGPGTLWHYSPEGLRRDVVLGMTDAVSVSPEYGVRRLIISQGLGREAAWGEMVFGVRDYDGGPLVTWPHMARDIEEVTFHDPITRQTLLPDVATITELAEVLPHARPLEFLDIGLSRRERLGFMDRAAEALIRLSYYAP